MSALSPDADFASAASTRSSVFGPSPERSRSCCASAAARSSSTVVIPSSCQSRLAVFGPRPGTCMIWTSPSGILSRSFWSAFRSPVSQSSTIFASIVAADPGHLRGRAVERESRNRRGRLPDPRCGAPVGGEAKGVGAVQLEQVGEVLEALGKVRVAREALPRRGPGRLLRLARHPGDDIHRAAHHLPADVQRAREPGRDRPRARLRVRLRRARRPHSRDRRRLPRRHRRAGRRARRRARLGLRPPPRAQGGARPRVPRRLPARTRRRRRPRDGDGLPTSRTTRPTCRGSSRRPDAPTWRSGRATPGAAASATGGSSAGRSAAAAASTRRCCSACGVRDLTGGFKCYRREPCSRRSRSTGSTRRATPSRSRRPTARSGPASRSTEIPITFTDRETGTSKMSRAIVLEAVWKVPLLRLAALTGRL